MIRLLFHGLGEPNRPLDPGEDEVWTDPGAFEAVLDAVLDRGDVAVSFDDGNKSDLGIAAPALERRGLRGSFFVLKDSIGKPGYLDASEVRELRDRGHKVGSHGVSHVPWPTLDDRGLEIELLDSRSFLEDLLGHEIPEVGIPFGAYDRRVLRAIREAGYTRAYSSDGGRADPNAFVQPRCSVRRGHGPGEILERIRHFESLIGGWLRRTKNLVKRIR